MKKVIITISQLLILGAIRLAYIGRIKTSLFSPKSKINGPLVIAANHASGFDPFVIGCFLPLGSFFKVFPFSFMTANVYYHRPWKPFAWLAGCYPAKKQTESTPSASYGVGYSVRSYGDGYTVVMFPEGKRTKKQGDVKPGISWILHDTKAPLLLCHIEWSKKGLFKKARISYKLAGSKLDINNAPEIMAEIYRLPVASI